MKTLLIGLALLVAAGCEAKLQASFNELQFKSGNTAARPKQPAAAAAVQQPGSGSNELELDNTLGGAPREGLTIPEPYRMLVQTTARYALANSRATKFVSVDKLLVYINEASYALAKTFAVATLAKLAVVVVLTLSLGLFLLPDSVLRAPMQTFTLDKYLSDGYSEKSLLAAINARSEELVSKLGLDEPKCRQKSICQLAQTLRASMPTFISARLPQELLAMILPDETNCAGINIDESQVCLATFVRSFNGALGLKSR